MDQVKDSWIDLRLSRYFVVDGLIDARAAGHCLILESNPLSVFELALS